MPKSNNEKTKLFLDGYIGNSPVGYALHTIIQIRGDW